MNKQKLIKKMAEKAGITQAVAEKALTAFIDTVIEALAKGEKVQLVGFGTFETTVRQARKGVNPQSGEAIEIPEKIVPKFKPGKALKEAVN